MGPLGSGARCPSASFESARAVICRCRSIARVLFGGTRNGRTKSAGLLHMELWDEELGVDVHGAGIFTLPEMELPFGSLGTEDEIRRVAAESLAHTSSGHARRVNTRSPAARRRRGPKYPGWESANRRARRPARQLHGNETESRLRHPPHPRIRRRPQVGIRTCPGGGRRRPSLNTTIFYDHSSAAIRHGSIA